MKDFRNLQLMEISQDQISGYSNNNYRGYETMEEAQQKYQRFLDDEAMAIEAIDQPVSLA
jgi:viroplasmin and RNaseH domain-containing protein